MDTIDRRPRRVALVAAGLTLPLALSACSGGSEDAEEKAPQQTSSAPSSTESASSTSSPSSSSSSASSTSSSSTSSSSGSSSSSSSASPSSSSSSKSPSPSRSSSSSKATSKPVTAKLVTACVDATRRMNGAVGAWNSATRTQRTSALDDAARGFGRAANDLRAYGRSSGDKSFNGRSIWVARTLDDMKKDRDGGRSVLTGEYNKASKALRWYCSTRIKSVS